MSARILNPDEEHLWSEFVQNHPLGSIHQSPEWGHFQAKIPGKEKYWIIVLEELGFADPAVQKHKISKIIAGTLLVRHCLPCGYCWLYASRGPLLDFDTTDNFKTAYDQLHLMLNEIKKIADKEKAIFLRIDPLVGSSLSRLFTGYHEVSGFQPDHTLVVDLSKSEDELLKEMKPKGRYNIKLAEKKGVKIRCSDIKNTHQLDQDLADFYKILNETTSRDGFHGHDLSFYKNMLENLDSKAKLYLAEYDNQIIAGAIITYFKKTATYYYGASSNSYRNFMAPYLLHWQAIKDAKADGYKYYDFFGIAPENSKNHPWQGVTEFKKKFGGEEISYQKAQELVYKKKLYFLYRLYKKLK